MAVHFVGDVSRYASVLPANLLWRSIHSCTWPSIASSSVSRKRCRTEAVEMGTVRAQNCLKTSPIGISPSGRGLNGFLSASVTISRAWRTNASSPWSVYSSKQNDAAIKSIPLRRCSLLSTGYASAPSSPTLQRSKAACAFGLNRPKLLSHWADS